MVDHAFKEGVVNGDVLHFQLRSHDADTPGRHELWMPVTLGGPISIQLDGDVDDGKPLEKKLLTVGDSITQGMVSEGPSGTYAAMLARTLDADLRNHGIGGHVFDAGLADGIPGWEPDIVTIAYGTNDWSGGITRDDILSHATEHLRKLQQLHQKARFFLLTPLWRVHEGKPNSKSGETLRESVSRIFELDGDDVSVIDGSTLMPHHVRYTTDGLHPNELGMAHLGTKIAKLISYL